MSAGRPSLGLLELAVLAAAVLTVCARVAVPPRLGVRTAGRSPSSRSTQADHTPTALHASEMAAALLLSTGACVLADAHMRWPVTVPRRFALWRSRQLYKVPVHFCSHLAVHDLAILSTDRCVSLVRCAQFAVFVLFDRPKVTGCVGFAHHTHPHRTLTVEEATERAIQFVLILDTDVQVAKAGLEGGTLYFRLPADFQIEGDIRLQIMLTISGARCLPPVVNSNIFQPFACWPAGKNRASIKLGTRIHQSVLLDEQSGNPCRNNWLAVPFVGKGRIAFELINIVAPSVGAQVRSGKSDQLKFYYTIECFSFARGTDLIQMTKVGLGGPQRIQVGDSVNSLDCNGSPAIGFLLNVQMEDMGKQPEPDIRIEWRVVEYKSISSLMTEQVMISVIILLVLVAKQMI